MSTRNVNSYESLCLHRYRLFICLEILAAVVLSCLQHMCKPIQKRETLPVTRLVASQFPPRFEENTPFNTANACRRTSASTPTQCMQRKVYAAFQQSIQTLKK